VNEQENPEIENALRPLSCTNQSYQLEHTLTPPHPVCVPRGARESPFASFSVVHWGLPARKLQETVEKQTPGSERKMPEFVGEGCKVGENWKQLAEKLGVMILLFLDVGQSIQ